MWLAIIVFIIVLGIVAYQEIKEPTHIKCPCGAEITTKSDIEAGEFQVYHYTCLPS